MTVDVFEVTEKSASFGTNGGGMTLNFATQLYSSIAHTSTSLSSKDTSTDPDAASSTLSNFLDLTLEPMELADELRWNALLHDADSLAMLEEMANAALADDAAGLTWDVDELL